MNTEKEMEIEKIFNDMFGKCKECGIKLQRYYARDGGIYSNNTYNGLCEKCGDDINAPKSIIINEDAGK